MLNPLKFISRTFAAIGRLPPLRPAVDIGDEEIKFFRVTQAAYAVGFLGHFIAVFSFWSLGVLEMSWFNMLISVPFFLAALMLNRQGHHNLAFSLAFVELLLHQIVGTYYAGWGYGLQYWLFYLAGLCFFNPLWSARVRYPMLVVVVASLAGLFLFAQQGVYVLPAEALQSSIVSNLILPVVVLALLINYFSRSALQAERRLKEEKAITEQQNVQLSRQHDSLVIEQDKTSRMLDRIQSLFGQQVSEEVAQELIRNPREIDSKTYELTIMFLDIRDFTLFADSREPAEVARFQNLVFGEMIEIVRANRGVVLQILGDGIMAVFGAPVINDDHADNAITAGHQMVDRVKKLADDGKIPPIRIGIGLNAGSVIAGNVGNESRRFYSLTGKNVIIAARIEQLNKEFNSQFLVSESVYHARRGSKFSGEALGNVSLKGIEQPVGVYKLA